MLSCTRRDQPITALLGLGKPAEIQRAGPERDTFNGDILIVVAFEKNCVGAIICLLQGHPELDRLGAGCNVAADQTNALRACGAWFMDLGSCSSYDVASQIF